MFGEDKAGGDGSIQGGLGRGAVGQGEVGYGGARETSF